jgi:hypothetical protein
MVKKRSANGGCLGSKRRRRTWNPAKSSGELETCVDPEVSEWGNPAYVNMSFIAEYIGNESKLGELKHLSTRRKRNQKRFP